MEILNSQPLISVILPIYNVERYIIRCLQSISNQTYKNFEVILVVDGATDSSYLLAKNFAERDKRFRVIYQDNAGSGPARNNGIKNANGEFFLFIDPDDWIEADYIEVLMKGFNTTHADMILSYKCICFCDVAGNILYRKFDKIATININGQKLVREKYLNLSSLDLVNAPTRILYKANIIRENNVMFPDLRRSQDIVFNYRYYNCIKSLCVLDYCGYMYRIENKSYALKLKPDYYKTIILIYNEIEYLFNSWKIPFDKVLASNIYGNVINAYLESMILQNRDINCIPEKEKLIDIVKNSKPHGFYRKVMRYFFMRNRYNVLGIIIKIKRYVKEVNSSL